MAIWRYGVLYLVAVSLCVSVSAASVAVGLCLVLAAVSLIVDRGKGEWPPAQVLAAGSSLIAVGFLATLLSHPFPSRWDKLFEESWIKFLLVAIPLLATRHPRHVVRALQLLLVMGLVAAVVSVIQHFTGEDFIRQRSIYRPQFGHTAVSGFFSHHLSYAGQVLILFLVGVSYLQSRFLDRRSGAFKAACGLALVLMAAALFWTYARSAWLGVMAGLGALALLNAGQARKWGMALGLGLPAMLLALPATRTHFLMIFSPDRHLTRLNLWKSSWEGIKAHPVLGFGPGNFGVLLDQHQVPGHFETFGHAHSDILMHGVNAGIPGMLAAVALILAVSLVLWRAGRADSAQAWMFRGALSVQVGITVAGFFQVFQTDDEVEMLLYFVLGCGLALAGASRRDTAPDDSVV